MDKNPIDAFNWLVEQFRLYASNRITWLQVREVLREAEILCERYKTDHEMDV
jgi:hypothetical protein